MAELTAVSLFAGIEGIGLALHRAGVKVTAAVEIDPAARGVVADRMPDVTLLTDVTEVSADDIRATGFDPDRGIITAGWPCQGNSVAGRRGGMADARSGLWVHVARLLAELRPRWFLGENVPGLLSVNGGRDFAAVVGDLAGLGYGFCWRVLDAQHFGVPQRRRRVFIVGRVGDRAAPVQVLLEPEGGGGDSAAGRAAGARVAATLKGGSHGPGSNAPGRRSEDDDNIVVSALTSNMAGGGGGADDNTAQGGHLIAETLRSHPRPGSNSNGAVVAPHENQRGEITTPDTVGALNTGGGKPGRGYPAVAYREVAQALTSNYGKQLDNSDTNLGPTLVGFHLTQDPISGDVVPALGAKSAGQGVMHADAEEADPRALLHRLREALGTEDLHQWCARVAAALQPPPVLRQGMHEGGLPQEAEDLRRQLVDHAQAGTTPPPGWAVRGLREITKRGRASRRWELAEQLAEQLEAALSVVPPAGAPSVAVRRLTPLEAERLQGFPDQWTATSNGKPQSDSARYRQLGNAVAVPCVEWIARRIVHADALTRAGP